MIALDMNPHATRAAQRNLKPFPNAVARGGRFAIFGPPGRLPIFSSKFDVVVSYAGALSYGSTSEPRVSPSQAMQLAAQSCREGGSVIMAQFFTITSYRQFLALVLAGIFAWNSKSNWLWSLPWWKQCMVWYSASIPLFSLETTLLDFLLMKNIARSCMLRKLRPSSAIILLFVRRSASIEVGLAKPLLNTRRI